MSDKSRFKDLIELGRTAGLSLSTAPDVREEVLSCALDMLQDVSVPILREWLDAGLASAEELDQVMLPAVLQATMWAMSCFGIGVEEGLGNVTVAQSARCLGEVSRVYGLHLLGLLDELTRQGLLTEHEALAHKAVTQREMQLRGVGIWDIGNENVEAVERLNDAFLSAALVFAPETAG